MVSSHHPKGRERRERKGEAEVQLASKQAGEAYKALL